MIMYRCHISFYLVGRQYDIFETIKGIPPLERFTHDFLSGIAPDPAQAAQADVILAGPADQDIGQTLELLTASCRKDAEIILLAERGQLDRLTGELPEVSDIWVLPMSESETRFRFRRWQKNYEQSKDFWRSEHFLDSTIDRTLEMLFSTIDCGVIYHSIDGKRIISINQAALRLLGYSSEEELLASGFNMVAQSVLDEDKPKLRGYIKSLKHVGDSTGVEYRVRHPDGKLLYILGNIKLVEEDGELFYQRFLLDFTAQKQKEEEKWAKKDREIQYREQLFDTFSTFLSDNVDDIYMMLDETGEKVEFVTPNIERVLGVPVEALLKDVWAIGPAKYITGHEVGSEDLASLEPGIALEPMETERVNQKTGERRWFRESIYCISVQGTKKIVFYISDRTRERKVQDALAEALNMAQVANKTKSTFLNSISHDIYTPLNAIVGFLTLLREEADDPEHVLEYTQKISAASQYLLGLVDDVMDINKIESGSAVLDIAGFDMAEVVDELDAAIRPQAKAKDQTFQICADSLTYGHLLGDKQRICQILINILSNAVKYTQTGGTIEMRICELPQVNKKYSRIRFTVSDNGQGMSEAFQQVIFDPFTRAQEAAWNQLQGTGLGMAITKSLVDLMGGTIKVDSQLGKGSTFTVELELRIREQEDDQAPKEQRGEETALNKGRSIVAGRHVLVVDDIDINRMLLTKILSTLGADCDTAVDGQEAVDKFEASQPGEYDLILMDFQMPRLNGYEATKVIRAGHHPSAQKVAIIAMTANAFVDDVREALESGMDAHVAKPIALDQLKSTIQEVLERKDR